MQTIKLAIQNLETTRERSLLIFNAIPNENIHWKLDDDSMSLIETIRHVLDCDLWYMKNIQDKKSDHLDYNELFGNRPLISIENEIEMNKNNRTYFIDFLKTFSDEDLKQTQLKRSSGMKNLDAFLLEIAYHEAYHAAQIQVYLRILNTPRANIW